jgi:lincosamide nucleotidyltransferase A/C/D/E
VEATTLTKLYRILCNQRIVVWLDGGWGVDALLGEQTRSHDDVDFVVEHNQLNSLVSVLSNLGYKEVPRDDSRAWNFVLGDETGNLVDIHVIKIDLSGDGVYGPIENGEFYSAQALTGIGIIQSTSVKCLSPEYQLVSHTGYKLQEKDFMDVRNLCQKFNLKPPAIYQNSGFLV